MSNHKQARKKQVERIGLFPIISYFKKSAVTQYGPIEKNSVVIL